MFAGVECAEQITADDYTFAMFKNKFVEADEASVSPAESAVSKVEPHGILDDSPFIVNVNLFACLEKYITG